MTGAANGTSNEHLCQDECLESLGNIKCYQELILQYKNQNEFNFRIKISFKDTGPGLYVSTHTYVVSENLL